MQANEVHVPVIIRASPNQPAENSCARARARAPQIHNPGELRLSASRPFDRARKIPGTRPTKWHVAPAKIELETLNVVSTVPSHLPVRPALMPGRCSLRAGPPPTSPPPLLPPLPCSPSENVGCRGSRGSRNFHANEAGPSELTTAYLAARPRNRFVRVSDKITAPAYR
jgi:hypothetical protein